MEKGFESIKKVFSNLKNKQINFNPNPWRKTKEQISSENISVEEDSFVDLHMKVAQKVDTLIEEMENEKEEKVKSIFKR